MIAFRRKALHDGAVVIDCRWLDRGGVGTVTRLLLTGLAELQPPGRWILWGSGSRLLDTTRDWAGASVIDTTQDPRSLLGQRGFFTEPSGALIVSLHHLRPLRPRPRLQLVHDTIAVHVAPNRRTRALKSLYLRAIVRQSNLVMVPSEYTRDVLIAEIPVEACRLDVLRYPIDPDFQLRVTTLRETDRLRAGTAPFIFALTRFGTHKNIEGLCEAFVATEFAANGGRLVLAGGSVNEVARVRAKVADLERSSAAAIEVRGAVTPAEADGLFAHATALVMSSLEEGFGLSVWEARTVSLPAAASDRPALREAGGAGLRLFEPTSISSMAAAIDAVAIGTEGRMDVPLGPSPKEFAAQIVGLVARATTR